MLACVFRATDYCRVAVKDVALQLTQVVQHILVIFEGCLVKTDFARLVQDFNCVGQVDLAVTFRSIDCQVAKGQKCLELGVSIAIVC